MNDLDLAASVRRGLSDVGFQLLCGLIGAACILGGYINCAAYSVTQKLEDVCVVESEENP